MRNDHNDQKIVNSVKDSFFIKNSKDMQRKPGVKFFIYSPV